MVFILDEGGTFDAPLHAVWKFLDSPDKHRIAHKHRKLKSERLSEDSGKYSWEQDFLQEPTRFTMKWHVYWPLGIVYEVLEGPFEGSTFLLYYVPKGDKTGVTIAGNYVSPTIPEHELGKAVDEFFSNEFEQDNAALSRFTAENFNDQQ